MRQGVKRDTWDLLMRGALINLGGFSAEIRHELRAAAHAVDSTHWDSETRQALQRSIQEEIPEMVGMLQASLVRVECLLLALQDQDRSALGEQRQVEQGVWLNA